MLVAVVVAKQLAAAVVDITAAADNLFVACSQRILIAYRSVAYSFVAVNSIVAYSHITLVLSLTQEYILLDSKVVNLVLIELALVMVVLRNQLD